MRETDKEKDLKLLLEAIDNLHTFYWQDCSRNNGLSNELSYEIGYLCGLYHQIKDKYYKKPVKVKV
jgi:hypothetical protein